MGSSATTTIDPFARLLCDKKEAYSQYVLDRWVTLVMLMVGSVFASATARFSLFSGTNSSFSSSMISPGTIFYIQGEKGNVNIISGYGLYCKTARNNSLISQLIIKEMCVYVCLLFSCRCYSFSSTYFAIF